MRYIERFLISLILPSLLLLSVFSCEKEPSSGNTEEEGGIVLKIYCDEPSSKAVDDNVTQKDGEEDYNENLITTVDYFIYPEDMAGQAVKFGRKTTYQQESASVSISDVTEAEINNRIFPGGSERCYVYVIVNSPLSDISDYTDKSISGINSVVFTSNFLTSNHKQEKFVMTGGAIVTITNRFAKTVAEGIIPVRRIAAKIDFQTHVVNQVEILKHDPMDPTNPDKDTYEVWEPMLSGMQVYLENGYKRANLGGTPQNTSSDSENYFSYKNFPMLFSEENTETVTETTITVDGGGNTVTTTTDVQYYTTDPSYTYPQQWEWNSGTEPYFKLILPWKMVKVLDHNKEFLKDATNQKQFYYKVIIPEVKAFESNHWYKLKLNVAILGSEADEASVDITGNYFVMNWQDKEVVIKTVQVGNARYLSIPQNLSNVDDLSIPFTSSHPCEIVSITANKVDNSNKTSTTTTVFSTDASGNITTGSSTTWQIGIDNGRIIFHHALQNNTSIKPYDTTPYTITLTIRHKDKPTEYYETITIIQKPGIIVTANANSDSGDNNNGYAQVNDGTYQKTTTNTNYQNYSQTTGTGWWTTTTYYEYYLGGSPQGTASRTNTNYNMYVIETTAFSDDSPYMIGDPRTMVVDNLTSNGDWTVTARQVQNPNTTTRHMVNYYPVNTSSDADFVIAPKFRIASSYGACRPMLYKDAFRRCASYQEDGYPAGRWRVPTRAELMYIAQLTADGYIPRLLGSDQSGDYSYYWCNSGYVRVTDGSTDPPQYFSTTTVATPVTYNSNASEAGVKNVRCVYDEWYWENSQYATITPQMSGGKPVFYWGDMSRANFQ